MISNLTKFVQDDELVYSLHFMDIEELFEKNYYRQLLQRLNLVSFQASLTNYQSTFQSVLIPIFCDFICAIVYLLFNFTAARVNLPIGISKISTNLPISIKSNSVFIFNIFHSQSILSFHAACDCVSKSRATGHFLKRF